jgi:hypothetical protein
MKKVKSGFELGSRDSISNALEIVAVSVAREFAKDFISVYEPNTYDQRCELLNANHEEPHLSNAIICDEVLRDQKHQHHAWTKACVMYFMKDEMKSSARKTLEVFQVSSNPLLKQTSDWLLKSLSLAT